MIDKSDLFRRVASGDDLTNAEAAHLCQLLDPFEWHRAMAATSQMSRQLSRAQPARQRKTRRAA